MSKEEQGQCLGFLESVAEALGQQRGPGPATFQPLFSGRF